MRSVTTSLADNLSGLPKPLKAGLAYKSGSSRGVIDGVLKTLSSTTAVPDSINQLSLGSQNFSADGYLNGHISRLAYFTTRKTDQELIKITDGTLYAPIITYGITSAGGTFNLRSTGTVDYAVDWDSTSGYEASTSNTLAHTYTAGDYNLAVYSDDVYRPFFTDVTADVTQITSVAIGSGADLGTSLTAAWRTATNMTTFTCPFDVTSLVTGFNNAWNNCHSLTSFPLLDTSSGTNFGGAWRDCRSLTSFPLLNTSSGTNFTDTWRNCSSLTSFPLLNTSSATTFNNTWLDCDRLTSFPSLNTSSGTNFGSAWRDCRGLTSFPSLNTSSGTNFYRTWQNCNSLTSFPLLNTSSGTSFYAAWRECSSLTSFPLLNTSSGTTFDWAWSNCSILADFPANMFDTTGTLIATAFATAWHNCALTAQSIENILVSLDTNGATGITLGIDGGTNANASTWSAAAIVAYNSLISKGWTITQNGTVTSPIITYGITNAGEVFNLRSTGTVDYVAEWGDGNAEVSTLNTLPHTYTAGDYNLAVYSDDVYRPYFINVSADATQITSVAIGSGAELGTDLSNAWWGASNMTTFACPFDVTSSGTIFIHAWRNCSSLTSFPLLDTSSSTRFGHAWRACSSLTIFPLLNTSRGREFSHAWYNCTSLSDFPANMFETTGTLIANAFSNTWNGCALTAPIN